MSYQEFIEQKTQMNGSFGFEPLFMPDFLFPFQRALTEWAIHKGRAAIFADCGLGKTPMQLVWAQNVVEKTCKPVLILTPLAVGPQTVREGNKFGIECAISREGEISAPITLTNYQRLHYFDRTKFSAVVCDESGILKNFDGVIKSDVTEFMRKMTYRLLCTATAAPNDYIELGTSSEAIGELGFSDMLNRFFKKAEATGTRSEEYRQGIWRFRGHAQHEFWRWVCSWARAIRKPSDMGFLDDGYVLPELKLCQHVIKAAKPREDMLFDLPAVGLQEQRAERRRTITERCEMAARLITAHDKPAVAWCHLNEEGHLLEKLIPGSVEVEGNDSDDFKEESFEAFAKGQIRVIVTKPVIGGFGLNWQHCAHQTFFPSHSFEQWYQAVRRCWRFGQTRPVQVDIIVSEGERDVLSNLNRKAANAETMFARLIELMNNELRIENKTTNNRPEVIPQWL